jgi:hypothetical protein
MNTILGDLKMRVSGIMNRIKDKDILLILLSILIGMALNSIYHGR